MMIKFSKVFNKTFFIIPLIFVLSFCTSARDQKEQNNIGDLEIESKIPPGYVKIIGKIIYIDQSKLSDDKNIPCGQLPCWAKVKIDSVIGFGAGAPILGKKDTLNVKFSYTLGKTTKELFPNLDQRMPGLKINSKFEALLSKLIKLGSNNQSLYQISTYKLLE